MQLATIDTDHRDPDGRLDFPEVTLDVRLTRRELGGWNVVRADNGRPLGWLARDSDGSSPWEARICASAFRGDGPGADDTGHVLDKVPHHLYGGIDEIRCEPVGYGRTREWAAGEMFSRLHRQQAPAVGFGRHSLVERWEDRPDRRR